jgi:C-terminal processing protease CtpA/Prc
MAACSLCEPLTRLHAPCHCAGTARTSVGIQLAGTKVRGLIPCGPAALSQRLLVGDEILRVDNAEAGAALYEMVAQD